MMIDNKIDNKNEITKKYDKEYSTQYLPEVRYLESLNIRPSFIKNVSDVTTYKYTKNTALFEALTLYYKYNGNGGKNE